MKGPKRKIGEVVLVRASGEMLNGDHFMRTVQFSDVQNEDIRE